MSRECLRRMTSNTISSVPAAIRMISGRNRMYSTLAGAKLTGMRDLGGPLPYGRGSEGGGRGRLHAELYVHLRLFQNPRSGLAHGGQERLRIHAHSKRSEEHTSVLRLGSGGGGPRAPARGTVRSPASVPESAQWSCARRAGTIANTCPSKPSSRSAAGWRPTRAASDRRHDAAPRRVSRRRTRAGRATAYNTPTESHRWRRRWSSGSWLGRSLAAPGIRPRSYSTWAVRCWPAS